MLPTVIALLVVTEVFPMLLLANLAQMCTSMQTVVWGLIKVVKNEAVEPALCQKAPLEFGGGTELTNAGWADDREVSLCKMLVVAIVLFVNH
jgi:hypothetical protein